MPYWVAIAQHPSPAAATWYCEQPATIPGWVGAGGVTTVDEEAGADEVVDEGTALLAEDDIGPPLPTPMHTARFSAGSRPAKRPVSHVLPTQGFHDTSCDSVMSLSDAISEHSRYSASRP